ncbi:MAG: glycosyltransferase family 4 protein [Desulfuromonadales bacterium]|nr:glycosyltransferase family 4 protein [Desulfuromonadales bacterium]
MLAPTPYFADRGCHVRIYEEARALIRHGCDVRIVTYHIGRDLPGIPTERIPAVPWYRRLTAGPSWQKPLLDILLLFKALSVARSFKPQILHAHLHEGAFIAMLLKPLVRIPLVMDFQGSLTTECRDHGFFKAGSLLERLFSVVERIVNRAADAIITSSSAGAGQLVREWSVPAHKVSVVIDGVDTDCFQPHPPGTTRRRLGIPEDRPLVVFLGILNAYQGMDLLLDVMSILKAQESQVHFLVMGYPEQAYRLKAIGRGLEGMVTFTGRIDYGQAAEMLCAGDLAISPKLSLSEANGKLFKYMACGLPTLVFETPVNREILSSSGEYAVYGDADDLATKITELLADRERLARRSREVREKAVDEHSWEKRAILIDRLYRQLLGS